MLFSVINLNFNQTFSFYRLPVTNGISPVSNPIDAGVALPSVTASVLGVFSEKKRPVIF